MYVKEIAALINLSEDEIRFNRHLLINAFDPDHRVLFWNARCEEYFGISEEKAIGKKIEDLIPHARDNKKLVYLKRALSGEPVYVAGENYDIKDGQYDQVVLPVKDADGKVIAAVNIVIDLGFFKINEASRMLVPIGPPHDLN